jgi:hypothetical protein
MSEANHTGEIARLFDGHIASPAAARKPDRNSSRSAGLRSCAALAFASLSNRELNRPNREINRPSREAPEKRESGQPRHRRGRLATQPALCISISRETVRPNSKLPPAAA